MKATEDGVVDFRPGVWEPGRALNLTDKNSPNEKDITLFPVEREKRRITKLLTIE